jgi:hypothetical protein
MTAGPAMHAIAYVSSAAWSLLDDELEFILTESRRFNLAAGVTGILLYCDGNFMQYFEGPDDAMVETWERIRKSRRHHQINELMNQAIEEREFGDWAMGFSRTSPVDLLEIASARWKGSAQTGPGAELVKVFWANCRA